MQIHHNNSLSIEEKNTSSDTCVFLCPYDTFPSEQPIPPYDMSIPIWYEHG
jgi:hypothetical protein